LQNAYNILMGLAVVVAVAFTVLVFVTGKGDAMSGGTSGIRTTFKGKASIEDQIAKLTMGLGIGFMVLMLVLDAIGVRLFSR
jgi:protein translocase SecG subunit